MIDTLHTTVTVTPQPTGGATMSMAHPGGPTLASVVLTDEIIDYLMLNLPSHYSVLRRPHGPTGPN